jgi:hypothetical protein
MSEYTKNLSAREILEYIASDYTELSHDKVRWQRDDYVKICREWLDYNKSITAETLDPCPNCLPNTVCRTLTCGRLLNRRNS